MRTQRNCLCFLRRRIEEQAVLPAGKGKGDVLLLVFKAHLTALTAARNKLEEGERIDRILLITVYVNAEEGYATQAKIADHASEYFCEELGEAGIGSRAAVGVASLPGNAPVEISIICAVGK